MLLGTQVRLRRLLGQNGRLLAVAVDQAIPRGVSPALAHLDKTLERIVQGQPDAITIHKGMAKRFFAPYAGVIPMIMKCSTFADPWHPTYDAWVAQVDEALRLGADAISMGISIGSARQAEMLEHLGALTRTAESYGLPVVVHSYPSGELIPDSERYDPRHVAYAARAAAELGVDIVKTWYTGTPESFREVVESCPGVAVVAAGGAKMKSDRDVLEMAAQVIAGGGVGLTIGRNVWGHPKPEQMVAALRTIVHNGASVDEALKLIDNPA